MNPEPGKNWLPPRFIIEAGVRVILFIAVNCAAIPAELIEAELFGHVKGSFTGADRDRRGLWEEADGGTVFLDEVTETSSSFQVKLLRVADRRDPACGFE